MNNKSWIGIAAMTVMLIIDAQQDFKLAKNIVQGVKNLSR